VLLAQGDFQRFLVASSDARQKLLRTLFRTERFDTYDAVMQRRAGALRKQLDLAESGIASSIRTLADHAGQDHPTDPNEEWLAGVLDAHDTDVDVARAALEQAEKERQSAVDALQEALDLQRRQQRHAVASADLTRLLDEEETIAAQRVRRDLGLAARPVAVAHTARRVAAGRAASADAALATALQRFAEVVGDQPPADLPAHCDQLKSQLAVLQARLSEEQQLEQARADAESVTEQLATVEQRLQQLAAECEQHQAVLDRPLGTSSEQVAHTLAALRDEVESATRLVRTREELARAEAEALSCTDDYRRATQALAALLDRRLANYAGTLAQELQEGEPCAVCGGVEHPAPATMVDPVTPEMIDEAQTRVDESSACARTADDRVVQLRTTVESLADVRSLDELTVLVERAEHDLAVARQAEQDRERARTETERIGVQQQELSVRRASLQQQAEHTAARIAELTSRVEEARGRHRSVVERIGVVTEHIDATSALVSAQAAVASTHEQHADADTRFVALLAEHGFEDEAAFEDACLSEEELRALTVRLEQHTVALETARATLAEDELQDLPAEPADVDGPRAAHAEAKAVCDAATEQMGVARKHAELSHRLARQIREGWAKTAHDRAEYEVIDRLAKSLHGESPNTRRMRLESYVLAAELDQIIAAANGRLHHMSSGRYALRRSDEVATRGSNAGLEVQVMDEYTGQTRQPESLSGGEKFLASLALALGLAEVVTSRAGGITLDTLFIDEGFGSLDAETLDVAMHTLDSLRENGRTIGLISHVEAMKERIVAQLAVERTPQGCSTVRTFV